MKFLKYFSIIILASVVKSDSEDICLLKSFEGTSENAKSFNDIKIQEFPFVASYGQKSKNWKWTHECTASVLTKKTLLTAAHCLKKFDKQKNKVIVGENDLNSDSPSISKQEISISHVARHPDYDNVTAYFDVAIIHTVKDIEFDNDDGVKPACLSNQTFETTKFFQNEVTENLNLTSVPKISIPSAVIIHYCAWYTYFWNGLHIKMIIIIKIRTYL